METRFGLAFQSDVNRAAIRHLRAGCGLESFRLAVLEVWRKESRGTGYEDSDYVELP